ncbi:MAG: UDP-N-acetylmuramoyl-L-alanine--D-glutamate ligase, partial [Candidatus Omnitrophica bacterium]|nr:UDP-N-acetylmuramoyl-L-alanine--D-glutamate ligase [Candidatus Omnitrophota bacterium]
MKIQPKCFEYSSYIFEPEKKKIRFNYKTEFRNKKPITFTENIILPKVPSLRKIPKELLENLLHSLHIMLGISYYKLYCPPKIKLNRYLDKDQAKFWNIVYQKGLDDFFYHNKIDPKDSPRFPFDRHIKPRSYELKRRDRSLIGIGGGKDSIVAAELLKEQRNNITALLIETQQNLQILDDVIEKMGIKSLKIQRFLDEKIFKQYEGAYNGHIPISAVFAFLGVLAAVLYDYSYVIVANEHSSNFGNIKFKGRTINHQWSKSAEFEFFFQSYTKNFISPDVIYFSALRPFYEIRITELFAKYKKYFPYFSSCNRSFKVYKKRENSLWCGECPKCISSFILLSAFLPKKELVQIFKKNLYKDKNLFPTFRDILGLGKLKPFDCVGAFEETKAAFYLARDKFKNDPIIEILLPRIKIKNPDKLVQKVFRGNLALTIPTRFRFLGMKNVLILGYGKEGQATRKYLRRKFPRLDVEIADEKLNSKYSEKQKNFDMAVKTPGISKRFVSIPYTTATDIFFSEIKNKNKIIGITGSKGKSTTTSLIYGILKEAGKKVQMLGNIGEPMLKSLMKPISKDEIFVLELSSYQLDDTHFSPDIAVVVSLFPEHLDYHSDIEKYYNAKKNIINFQEKDDFFIYNPKYKRLATWAKKSRSKAIPFNQKIPLNDSEIPLLGEHNKENIKAAVTVAKLLNISEKIIKKAIKKFVPLPHRLEFVAEFRGIKFYDDAISTTPESTIMAIKSLPQ